MKQIKRIIISRTDSIGDVVLTLPICGILKEKFPEMEIYFLGKNYVKAIVETSVYVDLFISYDEIIALPDNEAVTKIKNLNAEAIIHVFPNKKVAKIATKAKIPIRIGTSHRLFHLFTCNKKVSFSRKKSKLHEAQLNIKLLSPLGITTDYSLSELSNFYGLNKIPVLKPELLKLIQKNKFNLILHPKSKGSAREWGVQNFDKLINLLPEKDFNIFITGTKDEGELIKPLLEKNKNRIVNLTGKMNLTDLVAFISKSDGLLAASTGPLHIAAALGIHALGIYAPMIPIHPGRWAPIGKQANYFVIDKKCEDCRKGGTCACIMNISPKDIATKFKSLLNL